MHPDNSARIVLAAKRRSELTRAKAVQAIRQLERSGAVVTFEVVADSAGVSRSWLYGQVDLRAEIERLRERTRKTSPSVPVRQRTSDASLIARLQAAIDQCRKLSEENSRLRRQLAHALGERRISASRARASNSQPTLLFGDDSALADDE
jgi:2-succinyl-5-enolpyruvyl-6-hydroxy-3-cyclohexene-1-carboxylate synthase